MLGMKKTKVGERTLLKNKQLIFAGGMHQKRAHSQ